MSRRIVLFIFAAVMLLGMAGASPAAAQDRPGDQEGWALYLQRPGSRHEIDTLAFVQTATKRYRFIQRVSLDQPFTNPAGERLDRIESVSEYDCNRGRYRDELAAVSLGEEALRTEMFRDPDWAEPEATFREVFDRTCTFLVALGERLPRGQRAYSIRFVEQVPELINRSEIGRAISREYPPTRLNAGESGHVVLGFRILEDGSVDRESIVVRSATTTDFGDAALRVVSRMRFRPAKIGNRAVAAWATLPFSFTIVQDPVYQASLDPPRWCNGSGSAFCGQ